MKVFRYLRVALESLQTHKLRAILTMLGIIIGVAAIGSSLAVAMNISSATTSVATSA